MSGDFIRFLGTAGARFVMARQLRCSAGTLISLGGRLVMLDPGPGTLAGCARARPPIDPAALDAVILTHAHIDHSGDVNALLDAMTAGGFRPGGRLFAPEQCLRGPEAVVLNYIRSAIEEAVVLEPESDYAVGALSFSTSPRHRHSLETYGIIFKPKDGPQVAFLVDTEYFEGLAEAYRGADVLVVNVVRHTPYPDPKVMHLSAGDARRVIAGARPGKAVLTHFGVSMLRAEPERLAEQLTEETGVDVVAATDGMTLPLR